MSASTSDLYLEGFIEGRLSMARSIATKLYGTMSDTDLASLLGLRIEELQKLITSPNPQPESSDSADEPLDTETTPLPRAGLRLVEPNFVRAVRLARHLTQAEFARILGVHPHTICEWETSENPIRIKLDTYKRLLDSAAALHSFAPDAARPDPSPEKDPNLLF